MEVRDCISSRGQRRSGLPVTVLVLVPVLVLAPACTGLPTIDDGPSQQDLSATIARGLADQVELGPMIGADYSGLRAVLVVVDGVTVLERYYASSAADTHDLQSVRNAVLSTLVGIAVGEGRLRLDDTLAVLLPQHRSSMSRPTSRATLRQVLTMTAGFPARLRGLDSEFPYSRDWVRDLVASADAPPGSRFLYSDESAHLVAAVLEQAAGESLLEYARSRLFDPLDISVEPLWPVGPQGHVAGDGWLQLRPADLAKIGRLYLDGGRWEGAQLLPADWVGEATVNQSEVPVRAAQGEGYGYLWWVRSAQEHPAYAALGYGGQIVEVVPDLRLVVVTAVDLDYGDATDQGVAVSLMTSLAESVIAPAVDDAS